MNGAMTNLPHALLVKGLAFSYPTLTRLLAYG